MATANAEDYFIEEVILEDSVKRKEIENRNQYSFIYIS